MPNCRKCGDELVVDENWWPSCARGNSYICTECAKVQIHRRYQEKREERLLQKRAYHQENRDAISARNRRWRRENRDVINAYVRDRCHTDPQYRLTRRLRVRLYKALKGDYKSGSAIRDLGCSVSELIIHLENQFQEGMSWDNHGDWHIHHILPLASFDLTDREQLLQACHFTNLQPLWAKDNLNRGARQ